MANYTITRHTETDHKYGCTSYSTIQTEGQTATDGGPLDSTVVWDITADQGFSISIDDFSFTGASSMIVPATTPASTSWENLPSPILFAQMVQISTVLIRVTLYLSPDSTQPGFNFGSSFVMPSTDVNTVVAIEGCANTASHSMRLWFNEPTGNNTITEITVNPELENRLAQTGDGDGGLKSHEVVGMLSPQPLDKVASSSGDYLMSYIVVAESGYRYKSAPTLTINSKLYNVKSFTQLTPSEYKEGENNITGVRFEIYKK